MRKAIFACDEKTLLLEYDIVSRFSTDGFLQRLFGAEEGEAETFFLKGLVHSEVINKNPDGSVHRLMAVVRDHTSPITIIYRRLDSVFRANNVLYVFDITHFPALEKVVFNQIHIFKSRFSVNSYDTVLRPLPMPNVYAQGHICTGTMNLNYPHATVEQAIDRFISSYWSAMFAGDLTSAINKRGKSTKQYIDALFRKCRSDRAFLNGQVDSFLWRHTIEGYDTTLKNVLVNCGSRKLRGAR